MPGSTPATEVGGRFDPMLAKVIAWGRTRDEALDRLTDALDETVVLGLVTNLRFLRWLVRQPVVRDGEARTDTLDRIWPPDDWADARHDPGRRLGRRGGGADRCRRRRRHRGLGAWRLNGPASIRLVAEGIERTVPIGRSASTVAPAGFEAIRVGDVVHVDIAGRSVAFAARAAAVARADGSRPGRGRRRRHVPSSLAPMPGSVLAVHVEVGADVEAGDPVVTLEAMKMEHAVVAHGRRAG